jgi:hypothetical protein
VAKLAEVVAGVALVPFPFSQSNNRPCRSIARNRNTSSAVARPASASRIATRYGLEPSTTPMTAVSVDAGEAR